MLVRLAELEPLAMTALSSCAQPVTDTAEGRAGEDESHGGVTDCNGENRPNYESYCRDADMDGVLGVCHISKGSRAMWVLAFASAGQTWDPLQLEDLLK